VSAAGTITAAGGEARSAGPASWALRRRQIGAVLRLELRKGFLGKRALWLYLLALAPVAILLMMVIAFKAMPQMEELRDASNATHLFAVIYQTFILRIVVFLGCVAVFGNLIRREVLERSLHYYLMTPIRRELLVVAKYLTGVVVTVTLFGLTTLASYLLAYAPYESGTVGRFFSQGPGVAHMGSYLLVTTLACVGYGALFLAFGFFFRSPAIPALAVFGWEAVLFLLPPLLKKVTVLHYLHSLCPVPVADGPMALLADPASPWVAVPGLLALAGVLVALSARKIRGMEVKYEED
jgi:ABC-type transport system involved in multi-copper enzyme maturation permease subunit